MCAGYRFCDMFGTDILVLMDFTDHNDIKVDIASEGDSNHRRLRGMASSRPSRAPRTTFRTRC